MKSLKKKRRIQVIALAAVSLALATGIIGYASRGAINYYLSPSQIAAEAPSSQEVIKLGGLVVAGSKTDPDGNGHFTFDVTDCIATIPVRYVGKDLPPVLFGENSGTVLTGSYREGVFEATQILAKHDEEYRPKEVEDTLTAEGACEHPGGETENS